MCHEKNSLVCILQETRFIFSLRHGSFTVLHNFPFFTFIKNVSAKLFSFIFSNFYFRGDICGSRRNTLEHRQRIRIACKNCFKNSEQASDAKLILCSPLYYVQNEVVSDRAAFYKFILSISIFHRFSLPLTSRTFFYNALRLSPLTILYYLLFRVSSLLVSIFSFTFLTDLF